MTNTLQSHASVACKFGGSSLADGAHLRQVAAIVQSDPRRRFIVVSAPGKRHPKDHKVTDLLYQCEHIRRDRRDFTPVWKAIDQRYTEIAADLGATGMQRWLAEVADQMRAGATQDWIASRGEYLHARLIAEVLGATFVDSADCVRFTAEGGLDPVSFELFAGALGGDGLFVIPGFYGRDKAGNIKTFSRGGSDITGAIVARAVGAEVYENWTDVDGLLMADPRVIQNPCPIREVTYQELRELAYMGASVLHDEAIFPVREAGIPVNIRNTNVLDQPGTWIRAARPDSELAIVGIAGRRGFATIQIEKAMMNQERGFGRTVLQVLEDHFVSYEHAPSSIDSMSVIVREEEIATTRTSVHNELMRRLRPDRIEMLTGLALIATVGQGMRHRIGVAGRLFQSLAAAEVNVRLINQGASEINIIIGVKNDDFEKAIRAIYSAFVSEPA